MITNKRKAQLIIITTFLLGVIAGASGQYLFSRQSMTKQAGSPQDQTDELARYLRLTPDQREKVSRVLSGTREQYQDLRARLRPQYNAVRDASRQRIHELLAPDQQALFDQWNREQDAKREQKEANSKK